MLRALMDSVLCYGMVVCPLDIRVQSTIHSDAIPTTNNPPHRGNTGRIIFSTTKTFLNTISRIPSMAGGFISSPRSLTPPLA